KKLDAYLSATQLGITLASLALGWIGEPAFARLIEPHLTMLGAYGTAVAHSVAATLAFIAISWLHITFGELGPKYIAIGRTVITAMWLSHVLRAFYVIMFPAIWLLNRSSNAVLSLVGIRPAGSTEMVHSQEELRLILASSEKAGVLSEENREIIEGV